MVSWTLYLRFLKHNIEAVAIYFKEESVDLALTILDGANFRPDKESPVTISKVRSTNEQYCSVMSVKAVFQQKGNFQETSRPKKKNKLLDENRLLSFFPHRVQH